MQEVNAMMLASLNIMLYGVGGVFLVLSIFYFLIRFMLKFFPAKEGEE